MKRRVSVFVATVGLAGLLGAAPAGAVIVCPDGHLPFMVMNEADQQKDHNDNGFVCKKVNSQGQPVGGPDDTVDDII
ncbi:MAG TPA: hypothetical protein VF230_05405 [Acidimicrobiales bacterium]